RGPSPVRLATAATTRAPGGQGRCGWRAWGRGPSSWGSTASHEEPQEQRREQGSGHVAVGERKRGAQAVTVGEQNQRQVAVRYFEQQRRVRIRRQAEMPHETIGVVPLHEPAQANGPRRAARG